MEATGIALHAAPRIRGTLAVRSVALVAGLFLFALGIVLLLESGLGLSPWDVLNQGIARHTPLSFGGANVAVALLVLGVAWRLGARIGAGTVANALLLGLFVDLLLRVDAINDLATTSIVVRVAVLIGGTVIVGIGSAFYIGAALGAGPRDSLMLVLARRSGRRIGLVRALIEGSVTLIGFAFGGTVGIGTIVFALGIGPVVEAAFWLLARSPFVGPANRPAG